MKPLQLAITLLIPITLFTVGLPPVAAQENSCSELWVHNHSLELPSGFWTLGPHTYEMVGTSPYGPFSY